MLPEAGERDAATGRVELLRRVAVAQVDLTPAEEKVAALVLAEPSWVLGQSLMQVAATMLSQLDAVMAISSTGRASNLIWSVSLALAQDETRPRLRLTEFSSALRNRPRAG